MRVGDGKENGQRETSIRIIAADVGQRRGQSVTTKPKQNRLSTWTSTNGPGDASAMSAMRPINVVVAVVCAVALIVILPALFSVEATSQAEQYVEVIVLPGQTLWQIAIEHKQKGTDTRRMVEHIRKANGLASASIYPGQLLRIPVSD